MAYKLEEAGLDGILNGAQFPAWGHFGFHWITNHHNIAGMLTESASAKLATPLYIDPSQLTGGDQTPFPEYAPQTNFPNPWPGGWWRLRDIVERQKVSAWAILDLAARNKDTVLRNSYQKAKRQTERGAASKVQAYIVAPQQHDALTARKLVQVLLNQGIEVHQAAEDFHNNGCIYPKGTYVVFLAQPKFGVITQLLGQTEYPDNHWTRNPDGTTSIFDTATDTVAEYMGVDIIAATKPVHGTFDVVSQLPVQPGHVAGAGEHGFVFDARLNDSYRAVQRFLRQGITVWRTDEPLGVGDCALPAGTFVVDGAAAEQVKSIAAELGVCFCSLTQEPNVAKHELKPLRVGLYQRYYGGNADEGWTRFVFDKFEQPYETVMDDDIKAGNLKDKFDVLIFPSDWEQMIVDITQPSRDPRQAMFLRWFGDTVPPQYRSGIGQEGVKAVREFVEAGGRLVAFNRACQFAINTCNLNVRNVVEGLGAQDYVTHGSTLRSEVDIDDPLAYGMPEEALIFNWNSPVLQVADRFRAENYRVVVRYPEKDILQSGKLVGEQRIAGKAAMIAAKCGKGEAVLFAFAPQHRGQTHGTYKLLFNCLL